MFWQEDDNLTHGIGVGIGTAKVLVESLGGKFGI